LLFCVEKIFIMKKTTLFILWSFIFQFSLAQNWNLRDTISLNNPSSDSIFGQQMDMSDDGTVIAIGDMNDDEVASDSGKVSIYKKTGNNWTLMGTITGESMNDFYGQNLALSRDGSTVIVETGRAGNGGFFGFYPVYRYNGTSWIQLGNPIIGDTDNRYRGVSAINGNGSIVAVSGDRPDLSGDGTYDLLGKVSILAYNGSDWEEKGTPIIYEGTDPGNYFGYSVSLSADGNTVAIGAPYSSSVAGNVPGLVRVYHFNGTDWQQIGTDITNTDTMPDFGWKISLNAAGNKLAIVDYNSDDDHNTVSIYTYDGTNWNQTGNSLTAPYENDGFGRSIDIDTDGNQIVVGSYHRIHVFKFDGTSWQQRGTTVENNNTTFRADIGISNDGNRFAVSTFAHAVWVYEISLDPEITTQPQNNENVCPGSTVDFTVTATNATAYRWQVSSDNGNTWTDIVDNQIYSGSQTNTLHVVANTNLNNHQYRCIVEGNNNITSNAATLILDNELPVINSVLPDIEIEANNNCEAILPNFISNIDITDNCTDIANLHISQIPPAGTSLTGYTNNIAIIVTDAAGNTAHKNFNVSVIDTTPPVISYVDNQMVTANNSNGYTVQGTEFDITNMSDNCEIASVSNDFNNQSSLNGALLPVGVTDITWTVTDTSGNQTTNNFYVDVSPYVGINNINQTEIIIYPNPFNENIRLNFGNKKVQKLVLQDVFGKIIWKSKINSKKIKIDTQNLQPGIYLLLISTKNGMMCSKLIKQ